MKNHCIKVIVLVLLCWTTSEANAQWAIGIKGGWAQSSVTRSNSGRIDETFSPQNGYDVGIKTHYSFNDWLALRADLSYMKRSHRMDRNLHYLDPVYTEYSNDYLMLPVMADFSIKSSNKYQITRGHLFLGGFAGYWLQSNIKGTTYWMTDYYVYFNDFKEKHEFNTEDQRFTAGLVGGFGVSFDLTPKWGINIDALYYYDLVSHRKGYAHLSDPRYLNTLSIDLGVYYKF